MPSWAQQPANFIVLIALILAGSCPNWVASASPVDTGKATDVANSFLSSEKTCWTLHPEAIPESFKARGLRAAVEAYHVHRLLPVEQKGVIYAFVAELEPEGFIIMPGNDEIDPVLGFSFRGQFPFQESKHNALLHLLKWDMQGRLKALQTAKANGATTERAAAVKQKWNGLSKSEKTGGPQPMGPSPMTFQQWPANQDGWLPQPTWNQTTPYNDECPYIAANGTTYSDQGNGYRCWVGCTATAFSQIVNYWQYPNKVLFSKADAYTSKGDVGQIAIDADSATWGFPTFSALNAALWNINYDGHTNELAYLSFAAGVKLQEQYGDQGSAAPLSAQAYTSGFSYGSARLNSSQNAWTAEQPEVIANIMKGWPVQIGIAGTVAGSSSLDGHSIVIDGYNSSDYFHLNFGWGGDGNAWYELPGIGDVGGYDWQLIFAVVDDIAPYQGWSQVGADALNSYRTYYSAPAKSPVTKWQVTTNGFVYLFSGVIVGASDRVYAFLDSTAPNATSQILTIDQFGSLLESVSLPSAENDQYLSAPVQAPDGNLFVGTQLGHHYEFDPDNYALSEVFSDPDQRVIGAPLKAGVNSYLYVTANRISENDGDILYCFDSTNNVLWTLAPTISESLDVGQPAIDDANSRIFITSLNANTQTTYVYELNRTNGTIETKASFANSGVFSAQGPISLGPDGTAYIVINSTLFALNPTNGLSVNWSAEFPGQTTQGMNLAIGQNGTIYVPLHISSTAVAMLALDATTGSQKWEVSLPAGPQDFIVQPYVTSGGVLVFSQDHFASQTFTHFAYQDNGTTASPLWAYNTTSYGGSKAFGTGDTIYIFPYNSAGQTLTAISDGVVGDPEGAGMAFVNDEPPDVPSLVAPFDGANGLGTSVTLSWQCSDMLEHALSYNVSVCPIAPGNDGVFLPVSNGLTATSFTLTNLSPGIKYLWNVTASDGQTITESPAWAFTTQPLPQLEISLAGSDVLITWSTNAVGFVLESSDIIGPSAVWSQVPIVPVVSGTNYIVTDPIQSNTKFYRLSN